MQKIMHRKQFISLSIWAILFVFFCYSFTIKNISDENVISYRVDTKQQQLNFYWKDNKNELFRSLGNLKNWLALNKETLLFAMNGGMYKTDNSPLGLFIQNGKTYSPINKKMGSGNFYMKPNGIFYLSENNTAVICKTENFINSGKVKFATQSGPMLVIDGKIQADFTQGSKNTNIRNGVGILPDGKVIFAMSKTDVNFYDFANYFKKTGCKNALYLDGFVSRTYLPEQNWNQLDGDFGVIIGVVTEKK
jgi:uncharacterized protein YigE (DUF2233 family)